MLFCAVVNVAAQNMNIPNDPEIKKGVLPNGLTYYIRHNEWPEKRAFFYIAQNVGSMQEEDNQLGLAHFLEHMCFNGTKNFPGDNLKKYLEKIGVKFGENLNAYTSFDETVYNIDNVNVEIPGAIDSCLLILHDWSHDLLLEDKEIDKERGVINEEWRMRRSAMMRMQETAFTEVYAGSKYANRMPIGTMDIVMNFPYKALRDYYKQWYRPDLQAIVVVGDVDVDAVETKIKNTFADIKAVENPSERVFFPVTTNKEPIVSIQKDKEQPRSMIQLMWKDEAYPKEMKSNIQYLMLNYVTEAISSMFQERINDIVNKPNAPFIGAGFGYDDFLVAKTMDCFYGVVTFKDNGEKEAVQALYREILRIKRFGFNAGEYDRFKSEYLSQLEQSYLHRDKIESANFVEQCVRNYLDNEPMNNIEWEYTVMNQIVPNIPLQMVNETLKQIPDSNLVVLEFAPDKEGINLPTKEELVSYIKAVESENIEPLKEEVNNEPLISALPKEGKVKSIKDAQFGSKLITLKNGVKVYVKQTDFSPNQISMQAVSWGGNSLYSDDEYLQTSNASMVSIGGIGNLSNTDLNKKLSGIQATATPFISAREEGISGSCVKKDLETLLQLTYLRFTAPRMDDDAFKSQVERSKASMKNLELNPQTALQDTIKKVVYNNVPRAKRLRAEDLDGINFERCMEIYKERFADGDDFTFFFVGDLNADSVAPLIAKYLGALPTVKGYESYKPINYTMAKGNIKNVFEKEQETPNAIVLFLYNAPVKTNLKNLLVIDVLEQVLTSLYTQTVREDEGGAYSVGVNSSLYDYPEESGVIQIYLPTAPDKLARMTEVVNKGIEDILKDGPAADEVDKAKQYLIRSHAEKLKNNGYWMNQLKNIVRENKNYVDSYEETVNAITLEDIKAVAKTILDSGNRIEVGMTSPLEK